MRTWREEGRTAAVLGTLVAVLAAAPAAAQGGPLPEVRPEQVATRVTPEQVQLGQPFTYELVLTHPAAHRYELLPPAPGALGGFELLEQQRQREGAGGSAVTTFRLRMALFELGSHPLPPLTFEVATPDGPARFQTQGPSVEGVSSLPDDAQAQGATLRDLKPPEEVPVRSWRLLWALAGLLAAAGLAWAAWRRWRRPRPAPAPPALPPLPLEVRTRQALEALRAEGLPARGRQKEFYSRLTDILRGYLGERYRFEARECTTPELLAALRRLHAPGLPVEELRSFLDEADLVKFAKMQVDETACDAALAFGLRLVAATSHPPASVPAQPHAPRPQPS